MLLAATLKTKRESEFAQTRMDLNLRVQCCRRMASFRLCTRSPAQDAQLVGAQPQFAAPLFGRDRKSDKRCSLVNLLENGRANQKHPKQAAHRTNKAQNSRSIKARHLRVRSTTPAHGCWILSILKTVDLSPHFDKKRS